MSNLKILKSPLIFTGISGVGKSTLANKLAQEYNLEIIDVFQYVKNYIDSYGSSKVKGNLLKKPYKDLILDLPNLDFDILEIASDWPDEFIPEIIKKLKEKPILILLDVPEKVYLKRNEKKKMPVPKEVLQHQAKFNRPFYENLSLKLKVELIVINTDSSSQKSYQELKNNLKKLKI